MQLLGLGKYTGNRHLDSHYLAGTGNNILHIGDSHNCRGIHVGFETELIVPIFDHINTVVLDEEATLVLKNRFTTLVLSPGEK